ncbi:unnamed protein product, partial [marine sediment metagenome]
TKAEYCGRISILYSGSILTMGSPTELKKQHGMETIEDVFISLVGDSNG